MSDKVYIVLEKFDEGYDSIETDIKLVTKDKDKAILFTDKIKEKNKKEHNLEYEIEVWENEKYIDTI